MYENDSIPLRELENGDKYLTKGNTECIYVSNLGDDKHRVRNIGGELYDVPHGEFPIFKYKIDE